VNFHALTNLFGVQPFAFAVFSDQQSAVAAMHALNVRINSDALIRWNSVVYEVVISIDLLLPVSTTYRTSYKLLIANISMELACL